MEYPTLNEYFRWLKNAETNLEEPDNRKLKTFLSRLPKYNSRIGGHINTRRTALASWDWKIDGLETSEINKSLFNAIEVVIRSVCDISLFGSLLFEIDWVFEDNMWSVKLTKIAQSTYDIDYFGNIVFHLEKSKKINSHNESYILVVSDEGPIAGVMLSVGILEILRMDMVLEWANYNRKLKGIIQGVDRGADEEERNISIEALKKSLQHNYVFTSDLIEFRFHQLAASGAGGSFKDFIDYINDSIAIAILGQANTPNLPEHGGSRAALQVQNMISADIMYADQKWAEMIVNKYILPLWWQKNFGNTSLPLRFWIDSNKPEDVETNITVIREALASGIPLSRKEVYQKIGFSIPSDNDIFILGL